MSGQQKTAQYLPRSEGTEFVIEESYEDDSTQEQSALDELVNALDGESNAFVTIHRESNGNSAPSEFIKRLPVDKFDHAQILEYLSTNYGGGDYRIRVYVKGRVKANKLFPIAAAIRSGSGAPDDSALKMLMQQMERMNAQLMQVMKEKEGGGSRMEMMRELMMMKQIFTSDQPAQQKNGGIGEILEVVNGLKELGISVGGVSGKDEDTGFSDLLNMAAPLFSNMAGQNVAPVPRETINNQQVAQQKAVGDASKMTTMIRAGMMPLLRAASKNSDPGMYAQMVIDNVPEDKLRQFFNTPNGIADLVAIEPRINQFLPWFALLGEHVKACLGLESTVNHLYDDDENDSVSQNEPDKSGVDSGRGGEVHIAADS